jgi:hypothetical protein
MTGVLETDDWRLASWRLPGIWNGQLATRVSTDPPKRGESGRVDSNF